MELKKLSLLFLLLLFAQISIAQDECNCEDFGTPQFTISQIDGECCTYRMLLGGVVGADLGCVAALELIRNGVTTTIGLGSSNNPTSGANMPFEVCASNPLTIRIVYQNEVCFSKTLDCSTESIQCTCTCDDLIITGPIVEGSYGPNCCSEYIRINSPNGCEYEFDFNSAPGGESLDGSSTGQIEWRTVGCLGDPGSYSVTVNGEVCLSGEVVCEEDCPDCSSSVTTRSMNIYDSGLLTDFYIEDCDREVIADSEENLVFKHSDCTEQDVVNTINDWIGLSNTNVSSAADIAAELQAELRDIGGCESATIDIQIADEVSATFSISYDSCTCGVRRIGAQQYSSDLDNCALGSGTRRSNGIRTNTDCGMCN